MRLAVVVVLVTVGCEDPVAPPAEAQLTTERAPAVAPGEADHLAARRQLEALVRERDRLRDVDARIGRVEARIESLAPRLETLREAVNDSGTRTRVIEALAALNTEEHAEVSLFRVEAFEAGWTVIVRSEGPGHVTRYADALARLLWIDGGIRQASYPAAGKDAYRLGFGLPAGDLRVLGADERAEVPAAVADDDPASLEQEIARLNEVVSLERLLDTRAIYDRIQAELQSLEEKHLTGGIEQRTEKALIRCAERSAGLDAVRTEPARRVKFSGLPVVRHDLRGVGVLSQVADAVACLSDSGALLGVLSVNRVRREGRYRLRVELNVAYR